MTSDTAHAVALAPGNTAISIVVTAEDATTTQTYTVTVTRPVLVLTSSAPSGYVGESLMLTVTIGEASLVITNVGLSSSGVEVDVPPNVLVPGGALQVQFPARLVAATGGATVTATRNGNTAQTTISVIAPTCSDNVKNGDETDIDCGGSCGSTCAIGQTCSLTVDCSSAGAANACQTIVCTVANTCEISHIGAGTPVVDPIIGNCQRNVCDGTGNITSEADATDLPVDDGNVCTDQICDGSSPGYPPALLGTPCPPGGLCDGLGSCVALP